MLSKIFYFFLLSLPCLKGVIGDEVVRITSESEFSAFVTKVNSGTNYSGTTVLLDSDLSLSEIVEPIGVFYGGNNYKSFLGTFDGQGYAISDLKISQSSYYVGLFGYSKGLTVRNVVIDKSCSVTRSYDGSATICVGGIIGYCDGKCNIENSVSMADISFSGDTRYYYLYLGGIAGLLSPSSSSGYNSYVRNCANYGSNTNLGSSLWAYIGGISGRISSDYINNCINYGTITHNGTTTTTLCLGGIVGYSYYAYIGNCVSAGKILRLTSARYDTIGSIVGYNEQETYISYCYYTSKTWYSAYGRGKSTPSISNVLEYNITTFELSRTVSIGSYTGNSLVDALNAASDYYATHEFSSWILNKNNKTVSFTIDSRAKSITMNYQIILLPSLATNENQMFYWYEDSGHVKLLETFDVTKNMALYGKFEENTNYYTITFNSRNEDFSVAPQTAQFGAIVSLPNDLNNESHSVVYWETEYGDNVGFSLAMPAHNFTLRAVWMRNHIVSLDDFMNFTEAIKSGSTYLGTTVLLDADLSFSDKAFNSIYNFRGVFDGQGHVISNLNITSSSSSSYLGLFGYSEGLTVRNVVLDDSCSITYSYRSSGFIYIGGIIGDCYAIRGQCNIENSVNMADVTFSGENNNRVHLGGIAGYLASLKYEPIVKNCANYGSVTHSGTATGSSYIGGITGFIDKNKNGIVNNTYVHNCLNYGAITSSGSVSYSLYLGGIAGYNQYAYVENCVSAGKITLTGTVSKNSYNGSFVGYCVNTHLDYCYYTSNVGVSNLYGSGTPESTTGTPTSSSSISSSLVDKLNSHASGKGWNKWLLNTNGKGVTFKMNDNKGFILSYSLIILPDLASDSRSFVGWFTDDLYKTPFSEYSISDDTTLYGRWDKYAVIFNPNGGCVPKTTKYVAYESEYGGLPEVSKPGYTFLGWFTGKTGGSEINSSAVFTSSSDITLYALWSVNNYTVTFDVNGGDGLENFTMTIEFNSIYGSLPTPTRDGYIFLGWFTENTDGSEVNSSTTFTSPFNITLYAHWAEEQADISPSDDSSSQPSKGQPSYTGALYPFVQLISLLV